MPCIWGSDLVVVARLRAAAVLRLSWIWRASAEGPGVAAGAVCAVSTDMV
jgi:hypothetical protein